MTGEESVSGAFPGASGEVIFGCIAISLSPMSTLAESSYAAFHEPGTRIYRVVQGAVWALIVLSISLLVVEAVVPDGSPADPILRRLDRAILVIFAVEIVLRIGTFRPPALKVFRRPPFGRLRAHVLARLSFALRPMMLIDILAVLALFPELRGLRVLRLLRLLRTSRVFRYRNPFAIVMKALSRMRCGRRWKKTACCSPSHSACSV